MKRFILVSLLATGGFAAMASDLSAQREYINPRHASEEGVLPFSGAVWVGDLLFVSGSLGLVDGRPPNDAEEEARLVMEAIKNTVEEAGITMDDLVSVQVFCSDVDLYDVFNKVYRTYFTENFPARAFLGSGPLLFGARFEVMAIGSRN
ncbi:MAG: RidA family protein [Gemmatimonadota bacterium]|uniref:RidA family protein n=1 Tax=Candidatus Palauibacter soopunensis TaxID=3056739 RepID=UPI002398FA68|nr:RidA family protein [Candidatus Palauibacter soopunensis]MDE2877895.1 RidA family protein [Candidatus Palauibacter soopunensis]MDE2944901.1 RidA family protein [Gemmatimonadota bacterium]